MIGWLESLKSTVEIRVSGVKDIDGPTGSIGPGPGWTGERADTVHETLSGMAPGLKAALKALESDVQDAIDDVSPKLVTPTHARGMHVQHELEMR